MFTIGTASAQMVGATNNNPAGRTQQSGNSPLYHPTGAALRFSVGIPHYFTVAYGYHISSSLMVGGGFGIGGQGRTYRYYSYYKPSDSYYYELSRTEDYHSFKTSPCMPVFLEAELHTPRYKWSLFLNVKAGYNLFHKDDYYHSGYRDESYQWSDWAHDEERVYDRFFFIGTVGVSYKNISLGAGYNTASKTGLCFTYNLPTTSISKALF